MKTYLKELLEKYNPQLLQAHNGYERYISIDFFGFLSEYEPNYSINGLKEFKEWKYKNKVVLRMLYKSIYATKAGFEKTFIGYERELNYLDYDDDGNEVVVFTNKLPRYMFNLVEINGLNSLPVGYSSKKSHNGEIAKRKSAISKLSSENLEMWQVIYDAYSKSIDKWTYTGDSTELHANLDTATDDTIKAILNADVKGVQDFKVIDYIKLVTP